MTQKSITVKLSEPIQTHKGELRELELRAPKAGTFITHGEPFKTRFSNGNLEFDFDSKACMGFIADMSGHDEIILRSLEAKDFIDARTALVTLTLGLLGDRPTEPPAA
jgi:hypothetical protein